MDIEKLIEQLNDFNENHIAVLCGSGQCACGYLCDKDDCIVVRAATALSTLQAENEKLKDKLYDGEGVNLVDYWMQQAKIEENGHRNCQAENEKLRAELEQVKREFDGICEYIDSEGFLRKQFCENGNQDLEPCICPSLQEHPGYIDSDDCEGCDHFCNSWRGQKED